MPSISARQLRDSRQLFAWIDAGEVIELRKRNRVVAHIVPESPLMDTLKKPMPMPDFAARRRAIFGDRVLTPVADLVADRENSRY